MNASRSARVFTSLTSTPDMEALGGLKRVGAMLQKGRRHSFLKNDQNGEQRIERRAANHVDDHVDRLPAECARQVRVARLAGRRIVKCSSCGSRPSKPKSGTCDVMMDLLSFRPKRPPFHPESFTTLLASATLSSAANR